MQVVTIVTHPLFRHGAARVVFPFWIIEGAFMRPSPGLQTVNQVALNFGHALATFAIMLGTL